MTEELCFFTKDTLVLKTPKQSRLILKMAVLVFIGFGGIYVYSSFLEQISFYTKIKLLDIKLVNQSCTHHPPGIKQWEASNLHYPQPKTFSREECACNPVRFFAILSMQRSGSGWFETLLNNHTNVSSHGEIFGPVYRRNNASSIFNTLDKVYNLDWFTSASKNECSAAVGFKWMLNQGVQQYHQEIVEYFERRQVMAIFLFRRNLLRRMTSLLANAHDRDAKLLNGTHKSHTHSSMEAQILAKYKPRINASVLISELNQAERETAKAVEYFKSIRHMVVYYEDLIRNRTKVIRDVQKFLGLPYIDLHSRQVKIHTAPLSKQVQNWNEVEKALNGTSFHSLLLPDY